MKILKKISRKSKRKSKVKSIKSVDYSHKTFKPMLAHLYKGKIDPIGWYISEKLDGFRGIFDPKTRSFYSRNGNKFYAPEWFVNKMPKNVILDGELWSSRADFKAIASTLKKHNPVDSQWERIIFKVFDIVEDGTYKHRYRHLLELERKYGNKYFQVERQHKITSLDYMVNFNTRNVSEKAEGSIIKDPEGLYENKRSNKMLKIKSFRDDEAIVTGYEISKSKTYAGGLKALKCKWLRISGTPFSVGNGIKAEERMNYKRYFKIGDIIKVRFFELSSHNRPRFPTLIAVLNNKYVH